MEHNHFGRKRLRMLQRKYHCRAPCDGVLIGKARNQGSASAYQGFYLLGAHYTLIKWLPDNNFTNTVLSLKWYNPRKLIKENHVPFWLANSRTNCLEKQIRDIQEKAELLLRGKILVTARVCQYFVDCFAALLIYRSSQILGAYPQCKQSRVHRMKVCSVRLQLRYV